MCCLRTSARCGWSSASATVTALMRATSASVLSREAMAVRSTSDSDANRCASYEVVTKTLTLQQIGTSLAQSAPTRKRVKPNKSSQPCIYWSG